MPRVLVALLIIWLGLGSVETETFEWDRGYAAHYSPGLFRKVAKRRGLPSYGCYISSDRHQLGTFVVVVGDRTGNARRCLVADVSHPRDLARHLNDHLYELDYSSARYICGKWWDYPWKQCPVKVIASP